MSAWRSAVRVMGGSALPPGGSASGYGSMIAPPGVPCTAGRRVTRLRGGPGSSRTAGATAAAAAGSPRRRPRGRGAVTRPGATGTGRHGAPDRWARRRAGPACRRRRRAGRRCRPRRRGRRASGSPAAAPASSTIRSAVRGGRRLAGRAGQVVEQGQPPELEQQHPEVARVEQLDPDVRVQLPEPAQLAVLLADQLLLERRELHVQVEVRQVEVRREALDHLAGHGPADGEGVGLVRPAHLVEVQDPGQLRLARVGERGPGGAALVRTRPAGPRTVDRDDGPHEVQPPR